MNTPAVTNPTFSAPRLPESKLEPASHREASMVQSNVLPLPNCQYDVSCVVTQVRSSYNLGLACEMVDT